MNGIALKQARLGRGIKQLFIADKLGISQKAYIRLEKKGEPMALTFNQWQIVKQTFSLSDHELEDATE